MFLLLMFPLLAIHTQMCPLLRPLTPCTLLTQIISNLRAVQRPVTGTSFRVKMKIRLMRKHIFRTYKRNQYQKENTLGNFFRVTRHIDSKQCQVQEGRHIRLPQSKELRTCPPFATPRAATYTLSSGHPGHGNVCSGSTKPSPLTRTSSQRPAK